MIARWLYNRISSAATKEDIYMNLDSVLEKMGTTQKIQLLDNHPSSVSVSPFSKFYIKPTLKDINIAKDPKMLLFSAPGATGKSALAQHISRSKNALLWDLSKEKNCKPQFFRYAGRVSWNQTVFRVYGRFGKRNRSPCH